MTELDQHLAAAFASQGQQEDVNKVYLTLLRTAVFLPVEKMQTEIQEGEEPFKPIFACVDERYFLFIFDGLERLHQWAGEDMDTLDSVQISGADVVKGINEDVFLCLNAGTEFYKEFTPEEVARLKMIVGRIEQMKS